MYGSCAVVGSSGILLHHERGAEIDKHDMAGGSLRTSTPSTLNRHTSVWAP